MKNERHSEEARLKAEALARKDVELNKRLEAIKAEIANATYNDTDFGATADWLTEYSMPTDKYKPTMSITESHPRVLLTKDTIPKIKALLDDPYYKNMVDKFWEMADSESFTGVFPERTHTKQIALKDGTMPKDFETYRFDGVILAEIEARALAYLITGHKAYALEAIHGIKNAMLSYKYTQENHMDVYHGPSQIMVILSEVYDWCYDVLTEGDKKQLISGCVYRLIEAKHFTDDDFVLDMNKPSLKATLSRNQADYGLEFNFPPNNMSYLDGHGTGPQFLRDYMMVTVAFADEMPSWWEYVGGRYCQEYLPAAIEMYKNGYVTQGTAIYAPIKLYVNLLPAYLLRTATGKNPYPDYVAKCANFILSHLMPNGKLFETGDGPRPAVGASSLTSGYTIFYYFAALYNDTLSLQVAKEYSDGFKKFGTDTLFTNGPAVALALSAECDKASGNFPEDMPLCTYTENPSGQTITRNTWNADAAAVFMKIGETTMGCHDHAESGTFQIYYKSYLALTSGFTGRYGSPHHKNYHQLTVSKNGLLIYNPAFKGTYDGWYSGSQEAIPDYSYSTLEEWLSGKYNIAKVTGVLNKAGEYSYLAGDITKAYNKDTVDYVGRRMLTVFTDDEKAPMLFFVFDSITAKDESFKKSFLLHTVKEPAISGTPTDKSFTVTPDENGKMTATVVNGDGALVLQNVYGGDYMHKIGGEGFACWVGNENEFDGTEASGIDCPQGTFGDLHYRIWGRVEVTTRGERKSDMLNVMYVTDSGDIKNMPATLVTDTEKAFLGATIGDTCAMFARSESPSKSALTFTASGEGTVRYFISGLCEGAWSVSVNGGAAVDYIATKESGMIAFEGDAGTVTVTPSGDSAPKAE